VSARRAPGLRDPVWIEYPPLWPETMAARARDGAGAPPAEQRPAVVLTARIPHLGRRERPRVLRIVTGGRAP
jgi:hypothetical protein